MTTPPNVLARADEVIKCISDFSTVRSFGEVFRERSRRA